MEKSKILIAAVVVATLSLTCCIISLATTNWMKACIRFGDLMKAYKSVLSSTGSHQPNQLSSLEMLNDKDICYNNGLFRLSVEFPALSYGVSLPFQGNFFIKATAGLVITGLIFIGAAILIIILANRNASKQSSSKNNGARTGVIILVVGSLLYGAGMTTYTIEQSPSVHNPKVYLTKIGTSFMQSFQGMTGSSGMSSYGGSLGRKRRQSDEPLSGYQLPSDLQPVSGYQPSSDLKPISGYQPASDLYHEGEHNSPSDPAEIEKLLMAAFSKMDPIFDYSFYVAWLGWVLSVISFVLGLAAVARKDPFSYDTQPLPVL